MNTEQLTSKGERFKPTFAERDKKQTWKDLRGISSNWFKNQLCPSIRLSKLWALHKELIEPAETKTQDNSSKYNVRQLKEASCCSDKSRPLNLIHRRQFVAISYDTVDHFVASIYDNGDQELLQES